MFPLGTHRARPVDAALGMTSTGKEQIGVMFEHAETGERITWYGYFSDAAFERTVESLRNLGWEGNDLADFTSGLPASVTNEVDIVVEDEEYQGKLTRKVKWVNSGGGVAVKERLDDAQAKAFAARMKQKIGAIQARAGVSQAKPAAARTGASRAAQEQGRAVAAGVSRDSSPEEPPPFLDDDIPF